MAFIQSNMAKGNTPIPTPKTAGEVVAIKHLIALTAGQVANGNIYEMIPLPARCELIDFTLDATDLDTNGTPTITLNAGIMSGDWGDNDGARTCGTEIIAASTIGRTGGLAKPTTQGAMRIAASESDRSIGVSITAGPATAAAGSIQVTALIAAAA